MFSDLTDNSASEQQIFSTSFVRVTKVERTQRKEIMSSEANLRSAVEERERKDKVRYCIRFLQKTFNIS